MLPEFEAFLFAVAMRWLMWFAGDDTAILCKSK